MKTFKPLSFSDKIRWRNDLRHPKARRIFPVQRNGMSAQKPSAESPAEGFVCQDMLYCLARGSRMASKSLTGGGLSIWGAMHFSIQTISYHLPNL